MHFLKFLYKRALFEHRRADRAETCRKQRSADKAENEVDERRVEGRDESDHHKEQHSAAEREADRKPGSLLCRYARKHEDRDENEHQADLREHTESYACDRHISHELKGKRADRARDKRTDKVENEHQRTADKSDERF